MIESTPRRDFLSISLGLPDDYDNNKQARRQSMWRVWNRLSSLQRSVIFLFLLLGVMCAIYIIPSLYRDDSHGSKEDELLRGRKQIKAEDLLGEQEKLNMLKDKQDKLEQLKKKAKQQVQSLMSKVNSKWKDDQRAKQAQAQDEVLPPPMDMDKQHNGGEGVIEMQQNPPVADQHQKIQNTSKYNYFDPDRPVTERQKLVVEAFKFAWDNYEKHAWGHDEYHPLSKTHSEWFGVGLTIVDSIDTLIIMGLKKEYEHARDWVQNALTFEKDKDVNLFEITIRVLGGLLSAYHLTGEDLFKNKAEDLGNRLLPCFETKSKVPFSDVNLYTGKAHAPKWGPDSSTSEVTTIQLEFRDLSRVTKNPKYEEVTFAVSKHVHSLPKTDGLVPIFIGAQNGQFRSSSTITLGARGDSYYEYLLKQWLQTGKTIPMFKDDFVESVAGMRKHLLRKSEPSKLVYMGELMGSRNFSPKMDHLVCYLPGTLALGFENGLPQDHMDLAVQLTRTCYEMYSHMPTKLSPEIVYFNHATGAKEDLIVKPLDTHNLLRPETIESLFYMFRLTGNQLYRDWGWQIFQAFMKYTRIEGAGFSSINNVKNPGNPGFRDKLESFFLAETLKYFYLLFSDDPDLIPLDKFVFNSEAHPLPIYSS